MDTVHGGLPRGGLNVAAHGEVHLRKAHVRAVVNGGITELEYIEWRCPHFHKVKTEADLKQSRTQEPLPDADQPPLGERGAPWRLSATPRHPYRMTERERTDMLSFREDDRAGSDRTRP